MNRIDKLETLVDELIKNVPKENRVRACMEAAGLEYTSDPVLRMKTVLSALDGIRGGDGGENIAAAIKIIVKGARTR